MKQKVSLEDRIWMWANRKPPTIGDSYFSDKCIWVAVGLWSAIALIGITSGRWLGVILGVVMELLVVWFAFSVAKQDKERGYTDAIHKNHLDRWEKRMAKIKGEEVKTEEK